jgi:RNA polymerase sigma-70 factor (ECF subfamily)
MDHEPQNDQEWVRRVQAGEVDAFEPLVNHHQKAIFNLLYRWLGDYDDAAEVAQEVFLTAFRSIKQFRGEAKFSTWLYHIAINRAKNRRKQLAATTPRMVPFTSGDPEHDGDPIAEIPDPGLDPAQKAEQQEISAQVQRGLDSLSSDEALMILLHDLQGLAYEEIAQSMKIPIGTVKSRLHRARQALKARLTPYVESTKARR